ncbi:melanization protease 1 isoform X2 [Parasteatoda tepidariorum]|uniref:melanization protease 1 isoform X2 n=1 Tax=Parasteatoda tepidariorum TaxID=114398 RepID=UPI0039BCD709
MTPLLHVIILFLVGYFVTAENEDELNEVKPPNKYRFMSIIHYRDEKNEIKPVCAGTLITSQYVLSAAHCLSDIIKDAKVDSREGLLLDKDLVSRYSVGVGTHYICNPAEEIEVAKIIVHPGFYMETKETLPVDLMLLQLRKPVQFNDKIFPICLPELKPEINVDSGTVAGWCQLSNGSINNVLTENQQSIWSKEDCKDIFKPFNLKISNHMMCVGGRRGEKECKGDSGGPLFIETHGNYYLIGMTSMGPTQCDIGIPTLFSKIPLFMSFIMSHSDYIGQDCYWSLLKDCLRRN